MQTQNEAGNSLPRFRERYLPDLLDAIYHAEKATCIFTPELLFDDLPDGKMKELVIREALDDSQALQEVYDSLCSILFRCMLFLTGKQYE